jgi:hypothetical protein
MAGGDILQEVDDALRVERMKDFWKDNGKFLVVFAVVLVLGTAVQAGWKSYKSHQSEVSTSKFLDALKSKDSLPALQALSAEKSGSGSALAGLSAAAMSISNEKWSDALNLYQHVADNTSVAKTYRDLALVQIASIKIDHDDKATADDLLSILKPVLSDKTSAWYARSLFVGAIIKADKKGDYAGATADLQTILLDPSLPASFLSQIKALDEVYRIRGDMKK